MSNSMSSSSLTTTAPKNLVGGAILVLATILALIALKKLSEFLKDDPEVLDTDEIESEN